MTQSFTLGRNRMDSSAISQESKTTGGDFGSLVVYNLATDEINFLPIADGHKLDYAVEENFRDDDFSSEMEAVVSFQVVKKDLPAPTRIDAQLSLKYDSKELIKVAMNDLAARIVPLDQQWNFVKEFITSDYYFEELDELSKEHFLQRMHKGLIYQSQQ